eukprot:5532359-Pleurochrysis_carterae.AAC.1
MHLDGRGGAQRAQRGRVEQQQRDEHIEARSVALRRPRDRAEWRERAAKLAGAGLCRTANMLRHTALRHLSPQRHNLSCASSLVPNRG